MFAPPLPQTQMALETRLFCGPCNDCLIFFCHKIIKCIWCFRLFAILYVKRRANSYFGCYVSSFKPITTEIYCVVHKIYKNKCTPVYMQCKSVSFSGWAPLASRPFSYLYNYVQSILVFTVIHFVSCWMRIISHTNTFSSAVAKCC